MKYRQLAVSMASSIAGEYEYLEASEDKIKSLLLSFSMPKQ
jgi:copper homeostasis protein